MRQSPLPSCTAPGLTQCNATSASGGVCFNHAKQRLFVSDQGRLVTPDVPAFSRETWVVRMNHARSRLSDTALHWRTSGGRNGLKDRLSCASQVSNIGGLLRELNSHCDVNAADAKASHPKTAVVFCHESPSPSARAAVLATTPATVPGTLPATAPGVARRLLALNLVRLRASAAGPGSPRARVRAAPHLHRPRRAPGAQRLHRQRRTPGRCAGRVGGSDVPATAGSTCGLKGRSRSGGWPGGGVTRAGGDACGVFRRVLCRCAAGI